MTFAIAITITICTVVGLFWLDIVYENNGKRFPWQKRKEIVCGARLDRSKLKVVNATDLATYIKSNCISVEAPEFKKITLEAEIENHQDYIEKRIDALCNYLADVQENINSITLAYATSQTHTMHVDPSGVATYYPKKWEYYG